MLKINQQGNQKGQSLVELALFLPLFLTLILGMIEIGQFLVIHTRIDTAADLGARFGANGGEPAGMSSVVLQSVTNTLPINDIQWDIWTIEGVVNEQGTAIDPTTWRFEHAYGLGETNVFTNINGNELTIQQQVLDELWSTDVISTTDQSKIRELRFVGTIVTYDAESILNLNTFLPEVYSVTAFHVQRSHPTSDRTDGCTAFPIAISNGIRSSTNSNGFPVAADFDYPRGGYDFSRTYASRSSTSLPIDLASQGAIYYLESDDFNWVRWNVNTTNNVMELNENLTWPGRTNDAVHGYAEPNDPTDTQMHEGDWLVRSIGSVATASSTLQGHIDRDRTLRFIVYDSGAISPGFDQDYRIAGFVVMRVLGYSAANDWLVTEFVSWDKSCGQVVTYP